MVPLTWPVDLGRGDAASPAWVSPEPPHPTCRALGVGGQQVSEDGFCAQCCPVTCWLCDLGPWPL